MDRSVRSRVLATLVGAVAIVALLASTGGAADTAAGGDAATGEPATGAPISFVEKSISASAADLAKDGVVVVVRNDTAKALKIEATVSFDTRPTAAGLAVTATGPDSLAPGAAGEITLRAAPAIAALPKESYAGSLAAFAAGGPGRVARVPLTLTVKATGGTIAPKPLSDKVTVQAVRWLPFSGALVHVSDASIPLAPPIEKGVDPEDLTLEDDAPLGAVSGDEGGVAEVRFANTTQPLPGDVAGLDFTVRGLDRPGKYVGTLHLLGADESGDVELTIVAKDAIVWPIIVLGVGIWLALRSRRWLGVKRLAIIWERELAALRADYTAAARELAKAAVDSAGRPEPWADFDTRPSFERRAVDLAGLIAATKTTAYDQIDEATTKEIRKQLKALAGYATDLRDVHPTASALRDALRRVRPGPDWQTLTDRPKLSGKPPAFRDDAEKLIDGERLDVDALRPRLDRMKPATEVAAEWPTWHQVVQEDIDLVLAAPVKAIGDLHAAWDALLHAPTAEVIVKGELKDKLSTADTLVDSAVNAIQPAPAGIAGLVRSVRPIWRQPSPPDEPTTAPEAETTTAPRAPRVAAGLPRSVARALRVVAAGLAAAFVVAALGGGLALVLAGAILVAIAVWTFSKKRGTWFGGASDRTGLLSDDPLRRGDSWTALAAWVVALSTGLTALYFGETFGTPADYLIALLWGLTTATAVDVLAEVLRTRADPTDPGDDEAEADAAK